ncbi:hypothetical protein RND81_08G136700 [Saponaria officinalis]|uniref:Uncharacterized protein n=1 Tax=Saponaria officinalis TaxID=3572 RepID=A0AAW1JAK0_SAPOF
MNHALADATTFWHFWNVWSEIQRANGKPVSISNPPVYERRYPEDYGPNDVFLPFTHPDEFISRHNPLQLTEKLFRFGLKEIQKLKSKANEDIHGPNNKISSFQAVAAFIWRCIIRASNLTPEKATHCKLTANNRSRVSPPLPPSYFGNSVSVILTSTTAGELLESSLGQVGELLNKSVQNHTSEVINDIALKLFESPYVIRRGTLVDSGVNDTVLIVSSPRLDMYGNEFIGLGKPISVRSGFGNKVPGLVTAYAGNQGPGSMDFDICLTADCMKNLESDVEFMDFASSYESL